MDKTTIFHKLQNDEDLFVLMSLCTKMPYVLCDPETFDDEVILYFSEEDAKREGKKLVEQKIPLQLAKVDKASRLQFFTNLYTMGVNCVFINMGMESEIRIQLPEFIRRPALEKDAEGKLPNGKVWVENPGLHLTALYFMQELRREKRTELTKELKELQEEILADFQKGTFIVPVHDEKKGVPLLKQQNGDSYEPIFTDIIEFQKFNRTKEFRPAVVDTAKLAGILAKEAVGVVVNPLGINLQLPLQRKNG